MTPVPTGDPGNSRAAAAGILAAWLKSDDFPHRKLEPLESARAFTQEVVYGVIRWYGALEWIRAQLAPKKPSPAVEACLLTGLYQLFFMDEVETYAAVNETVEAAKSAGGQRAANLVNAVLRRASGEKASLLQALEKQEPAIRLSHPVLLIDRWTKQFGAESACRLCEWNNRRADVVIRVNRSRAAPAQLPGAPHPFAPDDFRILPRGASVTRLPGFAEGWFYVQDPSTSVATALLNPRPGESVLDACAAPGGKAMQLAETMRGEGTLVAMDPAEERLRLVRENAARLQWSFIQVVQGDITKEKPAPRFDAILLDVPCTNTGVIRRRPDARWRFSLRRLGAACAKQSAILEAAAGLLKPSGRIVYSTCSLEPEENEEQVRAWLERHPEFALAESRRLFPPDSGTDGAYAALLVRT